MLRLLVTLLLCMIAYTNVFAETNEQDDCNYFVGPNMIADPDHDDDNWYYKKDSVGRQAVCRDSYPTSNQLLSLKRIGTDPFTTTYRVRLGYCWIRTLDGGCASSDWETDGKTFESSDVKTSTDATGKQVLKAAGTVAHVCLKRYAPGDTMLHTEGDSTTNSSRHPKVCGYAVNSLVGDACDSPLLSWNKAWFGCVEDSLMPRPVTYNPVIASEITPIIDPYTKLLDYVDSNGIERKGYITLGSKFDQPIIRLVNSYSGLPANTLTLRYTFPGDDLTVRNLNDYPSSGTFPGKNVTYQAVMSRDDPSKVCACAVGSGCDDAIYIGCVDRPTPYQSDLAIVGVFKSLDNPDGSATPAVTPEFALTDSAHQILYYDKNNKLAYLNTTTAQAFLRDQTTLAITTTPTTLASPPTYKKLGLPATSMNIREYYVQDAGGGLKTYGRDMGTVYGVTFNAIIPEFDTSGNIKYVYLNVPPRTDDCNVVTPAPVNANPDITPKYYKPGGDRDRTYCACPSATVCPAPGAPGCPTGTTCPNSADGCVPSSEDALKVYCPGLFTGSAVNTSDKICLNNATSWNFTNPAVDLLCAKIIIYCNAKLDITKANGYYAWPKQESGTTITGSCDPALGLENETIRTVSQPIPKADFYVWMKCPNDDACPNSGSPTPCSGQTCLQVYNFYFGSGGTDSHNYYVIAPKLAIFQSNADAAGRNVSTAEYNSIWAGWLSPGLLMDAAYNGTGHGKLWPAVTTPPTRRCDNGVATVTHPCRYTGNQCVAITKPAKAFGYAQWTDQTALLTGNNYKVSGYCPSGYNTTNPSAIRVCNKTSPLASFWTDVATPMCTKQ